MATSLQLKILHIAKSRVFGRDGDASYRMLLRNVADVASSKDLDNRGFEDVMAVLEDSGFRDTRGGDYWRSKVRLRSAECGERMAGKIYALARDGRYQLPAMCRRFSAQRTDEV